MAGYPLAPLLTTRKFREDAAARELRKATAAVKEAEAATARAEAEFVRYREWRPGEEARLFETVRGRVIPQGGLDSHRADVDALRQAELDREREWREAQKAEAAAREAAEEARLRHIHAVRDTQKLEEHRARWAKEEAKRVEAAEEAELEDRAFSGGDDEE